MILDVINRRRFNEGFPFMLFCVRWLNLCAISRIRLPIVLVMRSANDDVAQPALTQRNPLRTNPWSAALLSVALIVALGILPLLDSIGWLSLDRLFNGPNPEVAYLPGQISSLGLIVFAVAAGIIAGRPIVHTLQARGRQFAHPSICSSLSRFRCSSPWASSA